LAAAMAAYNGPAGDGFYQSSFASVTPAQQGGPGPCAAPQPTAAASQYYLPPPTDIENEPPLLEELGINVDSILAKSRAVLNPFTRYESSFADEADMTGPVAMCLLLGFLLLLQSKVQFGVIYGQATVGCIALYVVFNLMSQRGIDLYRLTSILGYSLLPMVILSFLAVFLPIRKIKLLGAVLGGGCIAWSTSTATKIFVATLTMHDQSWLVAYPLALFYVSFAFITVF
jgi:protein YIPF5/7